MRAEEGRGVHHSGAQLVMLSSGTDYFPTDAEVVTTPQGRSVDSSAQKET